MSSLDEELKNQFKSEVSPNLTKVRKVSTILAGNTGDEGNFHVNP